MNFRRYPAEKCLSSLNIHKNHTHGNGNICIAPMFVQYIKCATSVSPPETGIIMPKIYITNTWCTLITNCVPFMIIIRLPRTVIYVLTPLVSNWFGIPVCLRLLCWIVEGDRLMKECRLSAACQTNRVEIGMLNIFVLYYIYSVCCSVMWWLLQS